MADLAAAIPVRDAHSRLTPCPVGYPARTSQYTILVLPESIDFWPIFSPFFQHSGPTSQRQVPCRACLGRAEPAACGPHRSQKRRLLSPAATQPLAWTGCVLRAEVEPVDPDLIQGVTRLAKIVPVADHPVEALRFGVQAVRVGLELHVDLRAADVQERIIDDLTP